METLKRDTQPYSKVKTHMLLLIAMAITLSMGLAACGSEKEDGMSNEVVADNFKDEMSSVIGNVKGGMSRTEELKEMTPTTDAEYRDWLPETIMELALSDNEPRGLDNTGASVAHVIYGAGDKKIEYRIHDFAGKASSMFMVHKNMIGKERFNEEKKSWYKKAVKKKGYVAEETYDPGKSFTQLMFLHDNRYRILIKATGFSPDEVWGNLADFKLDDLK